MNLVQVNVALVSTLILAVVCRVGERLPQPLLALRRLDQRLRQLLHAVHGRLISAPGEGAGGRERRDTAHIGTPVMGCCTQPAQSHRPTWALACRRGRALDRAWGASQSSGSQPPRHCLQLVAALATPQAPRGPQSATPASPSRLLRAHSPR
jgi:hypothetical protein